MFTIQIHDEQLARRLQQISEREQRPVEDILKTMVSIPLKHLSKLPNRT